MLTQEIANAIVKETSLRLNRNINIMNNEGIIIAARDKSRVGSIHKGALKVLKMGEALVIHPSQNEKWEGTQPGINLPIVFQGEILGVIGITGNPSEVGDLGGLVKMTTELMINQEFITSQLEWKQQTKEMIIGELLKSNPTFSLITRSLNLLNMRLSPPFVTIVIQITERTVSNQMLIQEVERILGSGNGLVGFINFNQLFVATTGIKEEDAYLKLESIYTILKKYSVAFRMAYSNPFSTVEKFNLAYADCNLALEISENSKEMVNFADIEAKALIYRTEETGAEAFSRRVMKFLDKNDEKTLETFFENNLNIQQAAKAAYIHRNTLIYRLQKIKEKTGYDPKNFHDALTLQVALWLFKNQKTSTEP